MLDDAPGQINFTMFLTLFGEKLNGLARGILLPFRCIHMWAPSRFVAHPAQARMLKMSFGMRLAPLTQTPRV